MFTKRLQPGKQAFDPVRSLRVEVSTLPPLILASLRARQASGSEVCRRGMWPARSLGSFHRKFPHSFLLSCFELAPLRRPGEERVGEGSGGEEGGREGGGVGDVRGSVGNIYPRYPRDSEKG